jgi:hypothetical protein
LLTGGGGANTAYSAWCNAREHAMHSQATHHLRLRSGEEGQIHWDAAICDFHEAIQAAMKPMRASGTTSENGVTLQRLATCMYL